MDLVTTAMLDHQDPKVTKREERARPNNKPALANLVDRLEEQTGTELNQEQSESLELILHYALGVVPGAIYGVLRQVPLVRSINGAFYGVGLWAINDEYVNTRLGLAGPFDAYPAETHLRGLLGHIVLGITTETGISLLGG